MTMDTLARAQAGAALSRDMRNPLPDLLGIVGDSRAGSFSTTGVTTSKSIGAIVTWFEFFTHGRFRLHPNYDKAVGGSTVADTIAQMRSLVAVSPKCSAVFILTGTNTFNANGTALSAWSSLVETLNIAISNGIRPIVILDPPRQQSTFSPGANAALQSMYFNEMIRRNAYAYGYIAIDLTPTLANPASSTGDPFTGYYSDGIHFLEKGAILGAKEAASYFNTKPVRGLGSRRDTYDATNNPYGNLLSNGLMQGTGGTNGNAGASGTVPDSWRNLNNGGTGTSVASIVSRTDGGAGNWVQLAITSAGTFDLRLVLISAISTGFASGDKLVMEADVEIESATNMLQIGPVLTCRGAGASTKATGNYAAPVAGSLWPDGNHSGKFITPPITVTSDTTDLYPSFVTTTSPAGGSLTIRLGSISIRKV